MRTIWSLWQNALVENRSNPAYLVEEDGGWREVSQQEAATAVTELAHGLLALGVEKGDSFGILARTRLEWVLLDFALAQIGAVAAPIYPSSTATEACYILEHSNVVGCLVAVGSGARPASWLAEVLAARDRSLAAATFAADGLYFVGPYYDAVHGIPDRTAAMDWLP